MLPAHSVEIFFQHVPERLMEIVMELRSIIASVAPTATEVMIWKGLTYYDASHGGPVSAGICQIGIQEDCARLGFIHGAYLPDPHGLLKGSRKAKRYVDIQFFEDAPWDDLRDLIAASARFDPRSLVGM